MLNAGRIGQKCQNEACIQTAILLYSVAFQIDLLDEKADYITIYVRNASGQISPQGSYTTLFGGTED